MTRHAKIRGAFWPTPLQERLLVVALADPGEAERAWRSLPSSFTIDRLEPGSFETLPLIYANLAAAGFSDSSHGRLKGIYRRSWLKNQLLLRRARLTALELERNQVRFLLLEGPTLAVRFYAELGLRPCSFLHVLVDEENSEAAAASFGRAGWRPHDARAKPAVPRYFDDADAHLGVLRTAISSDFVFSGSRSAALDPIWDAAQPCRLEDGEVEASVPSASDLLVAVCALGARRASAPNTQWLLDAAMILRSGLVDGDRLLETTRRGGQELRMREALRYLATLPDTNVPRDVLDALERADLNVRQRAAYELASGSRRPGTGVADLIADHLALTAHGSPVASLVSLPAYLRWRWDLSSSARIPAAAARRVIRHLANTRNMSL